MDANIKPQFVIDASFVLSFLLPDENIEEVERFFDKNSLNTIILVSTLLLPFETLNTLKIAQARGRITKKRATLLVERFLNLGIVLEEVNFKKVFLTSQAKNLTVYDASYLQLALSQKIPLLTLDDKLQKLSPKFS